MEKMLLLLGYQFPNNKRIFLLFLSFLCCKYWEGKKYHPTFWIIFWKPNDQLVCHIERSSESVSLNLCFIILCFSENLRFYINSLFKDKITRVDKKIELTHVQFKDTYTKQRYMRNYKKVMEKLLYVITKNLEATQCPYTGE